MHPDHHQIIERIYTENHQAAAKILAKRHHCRSHDPAVQDAIATAALRVISFLERGGQVDPDDALGWFVTVAHREYGRPLAGPEARRTQPLDEWVQNTAAAPGALLEDVTIDAAADVGIQRALDRALGRLSRLQREVITAQACGLTYTEISRRTGLSNTAVDKAIQRARRNLRIDGRLAKELRAWRD